MRKTYFVGHGYHPFVKRGCIAYSPVIFGGSMWESNPPKQLLTTLTGFEDQGPHQQPSTPGRLCFFEYYMQYAIQCLPYFLGFENLRNKLTIACSFILAKIFVTPERQQKRYDVIPF